MEHNVYIYILVMGAATYLVRAVPLIFIRHELKNTIIRSFLYYVPYVTLAVMTFPSILEATRSPVSALAALITGILAALDKKTGETVWEFNTGKYVWSSPVDLYDENGNAYIITCNSVGDMMLLDGRSGKLIDRINLGANIEASPAVFGDTLVVGTRGQKIYGIKIES